MALINTIKRIPRREYWKSLQIDVVYFAVNKKVMPVIISEEQFKSRYLVIKERFQDLKTLDINDPRWRKVERVIKNMKQAYGRDKVYAVKYMNLLEKYQPSFSEQKRALIVRAIELMQKVILHKKLNRKN